MDRGRYAGPVGWLDASGDGEWGIALRCGQVGEDPHEIRLFAGCGIVEGSDPAAELAESAAKFVPDAGRPRRLRPVSRCGTDPAGRWTAGERGATVGARPIQSDRETWLVDVAATPRQRVRVLPPGPMRSSACAHPSPPCGGCPTGPTTRA